MTEFLLFIETYRERLIHHAFYRIGSLEEAEDIVQEVFVKIYTQNACNVKNLEAYLYKMTMNACIDFIRRQKTKLQMMQNLEVENEQTSENEAVRNITIQEEYTRINNILKTLPEEQSEVVRFRVIDELNFKEIATILGKPESTIKSRFQYAIKKIKSHEM